MFKPIITTALLLSAASAWAGSPIDERRPLKADAALRVANTCGNIEIAVWDRSEVHITGELGEGAEELLISGNDSSLTVEVRNPKKNSNYEDTSLKLLVPAGVKLDVEGVSSDIAVQGVKGPLKVNSVSGDVTLSVMSPELSARSVSGDITVRASSKDTRINSVSGDIHAAGLQGALTLETVSGNVELIGGNFGEASLKSISGDFDLAMNLSPDARLTGETLSGQIALRLPSSTSAVVSLSTFSGDVNSAFGGEMTTSRRKEKLEFKVGDGRGRIDLSSFSGDIEITKK